MKQKRMSNFLSFIWQPRKPWERKKNENWNFESHVSNDWNIRLTRGFSYSKFYFIFSFLYVSRQPNETINLFITENKNVKHEFSSTCFELESKTESNMNFRSPTDNVSEESFFTVRSPSLSCSFTGLILTTTYHTKHKNHAKQSN